MSITQLKLALLTFCSDYSSETPTCCLLFCTVMQTVEITTVIILVVLFLKFHVAF